VSFLYNHFNNAYVYTTSSFHSSSFIYATLFLHYNSAVMLT